MYERTHNCGELRESEIGEEVRLSGWVHRRRDHGGLIFIDLRDKFGLTQLVFDPEIATNPHEVAQALRSEWVITVSGKVRHRGEGLVNPKLATGAIEIEALELDILARAKTPPFSVADEFIDVNEELRLTYRYLDMRRGEVLQNMLTRHKAMLVTRNFLDENGFSEISTPILGKSTPEGARDYLVPSRVHPGTFYALPQSPQIFKQLLMVSGVDRYFQIAPCFRDEDLRSDRQPEFTQIDIEMSFGTTKTFLPMMETLIKRLFLEVKGIEIEAPFVQMSHVDCMERYGTDRPDLRFGMPLTRLNDAVSGTEFAVFKEAECIKAICVKGGAEKSRREIDKLIEFVKPFGLGGLAWMKKVAEGYTSSIVKFFTPEQLEKIGDATGAEEGDLLLIAASDEASVNQAMDHLRRHLGKDLVTEDQFAFTWVVDFPLFSWNEKDQRIQAEHHPFTAPHPDDIEKIETDPFNIRSVAYDLVLNGYEIGGGSQRIHDSDLQAKIFQALKLSDEEVKEKFGFFIDALSYGTPPHLGIAFGLDRIVMLLCGTDNIRDVIAFPKTQRASDLMMEAPAHVREEQLRELDLECKTGVN